MTGMTLEVNTDVLQYLMIALVTESTEERSTVPKDAIEDILNVLCELNKLCSEKNNYTITMEVSA